MGCGASAPTQEVYMPKKECLTQDAAENAAVERSDMEGISDEKGFELKAGRKEGRFIVKTKKGASLGLTASGHTTDVDFNGISMSRVDAKAPVKPRKKK